MAFLLVSERVLLAYLADMARKRTYWGTRKEP